MRKITKEASDAFMSSTPFKKANMEIEVLPLVTIMQLHGNAIAFLHNDPNRTLHITNAGWESNTTKERLNSLPGVSIYQKNGEWYLNGEKWNGKLIEISNYKD